MTPEQDLLQRIRRALARTEVDIDELVDEAYADARAEVVDALRRMIGQDLLARAVAALGGEPPAAPGSSEGRAEGGTAGDERPPARERPSAPERPPADESTIRGESTTAEERPSAGETASQERPAPSVTVGNGRRPAEGLATYVYGIADGDRTAAPDGLALPPSGHAPRWVVHDGVRALVCDVDPTTFEALRTPGPEGLDTLAAAAHAHDATLAAMAAETTVLPLPLGTVLPEDEALTRLLATHAPRLRAELERLRGCAEWSVTVRTLGDEGGDRDTRAREAVSGRDYLRQRGAALEERTSRWERREELAGRIHERLAACAREADTVATRPVEDAAPPLLHGVYLLDQERVDELEDLVVRLRDEHPETAIEVAGPWPPYHFTAIDLAGEGDAS